MQKLLVQKGSFYALAGVFGIVASVFLAYSFYLWLSTIWQPAVAALGTGGVILFLAFLVFQVAASLGQSSTPQHDLKPAEIANKVEHELDALVGPQVAHLVARNAKTATLAALGMGLAAGKSGEVRKMLAQLVQEYGQGTDR